MSKTVRFWHEQSGDFTAPVPPEGFTVGRTGGGADLEFHGDKHMSRRHGRIWVKDNAVWYEDLGSANGSWLDGQRLGHAIRLLPGVTVVLGDTTLTLGDEVSVEREPRKNEGMTLRLEAPTQTAAPLAEAYVKALYEFVQALLETTSRELIPRTLKRIYEVVPAAQRISLVAWPPDEEGRFTHLIPPEELHLKFTGGPISVSLARYAVENGQALLLSEDLPAVDPAAGHSAEMHGIRSAVYVPLQRPGGEVFGVLCVDTPRPSLPFTDGDFQFVRAAGGLLATALTSEQAREQAQQKELEAREMGARHEAMTAFLKIASHDLKNPLTAINLSAQLLKRTKEDPEKIDRFAATILDSVQRARELIGNYLEVAQLETALELELEEIDMVQLVEHEVAFIRDAVTGQQEHPPTFHTNVDCPAVKADRAKLRQILSNLISNAVKYSPQGGQVLVEAVGAQDGSVIVRVHDQGVGISEEDQQKLFKQFQRVGDRSLASGTGLGLWLTQALVEAHGGRIGVKSAPGQGSTFAFSLPGGGST